MIRGKNISFSHIGDPLYDKSSFSVNRGEKVGLVGQNGSGKSTLFRLITGAYNLEEGEIHVEGTVGYVPQEVGKDRLQESSRDIKEYLLTAGDFADHYLNKCLRDIELDDLDLSIAPSRLSGGQKTKLALLHALLSEPDILLLDEPTNFMDTAGKKWVMDWLSRYKKTLLVVSHDLNLLDRHIDKIIYINSQTKKFEEFTGSYTMFKKLKAEKDAHLTRYIRNQQQKVKQLRTSATKLRQSNSEKKVRAGILLEKRITRIEDALPELPREITRIKLKLPTPTRIGELPVQAKNLSKSYGHSSVIKDFSFSIVRGQRVALIGHNGAGKSTLIKLIIGLTKPTSGIVTLDTEADIGYYSQELETFDLDKSLLEAVKEENELASDGQIRTFLAKFMFNRNRVKQRIGSLSGGEKTRLSIALLMLHPHNFLILDEPTTYLDATSQRIILDALKEYRGTMLVVSHTADFLKELKPDRAILLPEEKLVYWDNDLLGRASEI